MGLETRIWALRLGFRALGWDLSLEAGGKNARMNERKSLCVLQDIFPFGAAAQKAKTSDAEEDFYLDKFGISPCLQMLGAPRRY